MSRNRIVILLISITLLLGFSSNVDAQEMPFNVTLNWVSSIDPMVFSIGKLIPGNLSDPDDIDFGDLQPFFQMLVTSNDPMNYDPDQLVVLWVRMKDSAGLPIFTIFTNRIPVSHLVGGWIDNNMIANDPTIGLDTDTDLGPEDLLPYLDGGNIREGTYEISAYITEQGRRHVNDNVDVENVGVEKLGVGTLLFWVHNPSQVSLLSPDPAAVINSENVTFNWRFQRSPGLSFNLRIVSGDVGEDPWTAIETYGDDSNHPKNFANLVIAVNDNAGDLTPFLYTGSPGAATGNARTLLPGNIYHWQVTASVPTMFEGQNIEISSAVYSFSFPDPDAGDGVGGQGGEEEGGAPQPEAAIFTLLRQTMDTDQFTGVKAALEADSELNSWTLDTEGSIRIDGFPVSQDELSRFLLLGEHRVSFVGVQE